MVVKSRVGSGGRGLVWVDQDPEKLRHLLTDDVIIESPIKGTEGSVESLIQDGRVLFTNITRYTKVGTENRVPGDYPQEIQRDILELNQRVLSEIGIQWGLTHLEFYHTEANQILFGEVALRPPGGYIMQAMELAYDYDFWRAFVEIELGQSVTPPSVQAMAFAASVIFHPGEKSKITRIEGKAEAKALASMVKVRIKVKVGDSVKNRTSVGEDVGYALLKHEDPDQLTKDLEALHQTLHID